MEKDKTYFWVVMILLMPGFALAMLEIMRMVFALARYSG